MALFKKKSPMDSWRAKHRVAAAFVDATGWDVDVDLGVVHTRIDGTAVTVLLSGSDHARVGVIIEGGAQAERTLANTFGDDGGKPFDFDGWAGVAAPGSGLIEASDQGGEDLHGKVVAAATHLVQQIKAT